MAQTNWTTTEYATLAVNNQLMRGLLETAKRHFPYMNGTVPGQLERNQDTFTVKWERLNNLAIDTTALAEKSLVSFQMGRTPAAPTLSNLTAVVQKYGQFINVSENIDLVKINARTMQLVDVLGEAAGASANALQRNIYDAQTTFRFSGGVASSDLIVTAISDNDVKYVVQSLRNASARKFFPVETGSVNIGTLPILDSYFGVCHSLQVESIRALTNFTSVEKYAGQVQPLVGEIGHAHEVRWCHSEIAPVNSGAGTTSAAGFHGASDILNDVFSVFVWGKESAGTVGLAKEWPNGIYRGGDDAPSPVELVTKAVGSAGAADPHNEWGTVAYNLRHAGKVLNSAWIKKIEALAPDFA